jgi:hypothetical protein
MMVEGHPFAQLISGKAVRRMLAQEYWYMGQIHDPVNVLFAELDDESWARFFFDAGVFFWSTVQSPTLPDSNETHQYSLRDLGCSGTVEAADLVESFDAARLRIHFADGRVLELNNSQDRSWLGQVKN